MGVHYFPLPGSQQGDKPRGLGLWLALGGRGGGGGGGIGTGLRAGMVTDKRNPNGRPV